MMVPSFGPHQGNFASLDSLSPAQPQLGPPGPDQACCVQLHPEASDVGLLPSSFLDSSPDQFHDRELGPHPHLGQQAHGYGEHEDAMNHTGSSVGSRLTGLTDGSTTYRGRL